MKCADLHIHSNFSDGTLTPEEIVKMAEIKGIKSISITDHDCISSQYIKEKVNKINIISGIEISSEINELDIHILGYFINYKDENLINVVNKLKEDRIKRVKEILFKLKKENIFIEIEDLDVKGTSSIGRSHIAKAMVEKGYFNNYKSAFTNYLVQGKPAFVKGHKLDYKSTIEVITRSGGIAVLAHPGQVYKNLEIEYLVRELKCFGLEGLEVYHPSHDIEQTNKFYNLAKKYKLLITGGSDYHGKDCYNEKLIGSYGINEKLLNKLLMYNK
ncbi:PHP domain-containing protein [Clostridium sp.]|uniref:PHP domain-containing protein n=1 Tax=Clostridium sp. TaxID=1506 RepID=UPI0026139F74|nr:PHP domain-containing protein [Clostridium sp.]